MTAPEQAVAAAVPPPMIETVPAGGMNLVPLLVGLAALAGVAALILSQSEDATGILTPISPQ